jgi:hypothetical protein
MSSWLWRAAMTVAGAVLPMEVSMWEVDILVFGWGLEVEMEDEALIEM